MTVPLKGEFNNFDNVRLNDAPRCNSNILEGLRIWIPLTGVIVFLEAPKATIAFEAVFGLNFPSNSKCDKYICTKQDI